MDIIMVLPVMVGRKVMEKEPEEREEPEEPEEDEDEQRRILPAGNDY